MTTGPAQTWRLTLVSLLGAATLGVAAVAQQQPSSNGGNYLGSRLVPAKPEGSCPPNVDPLYSSYAIVTGTDMRQRPWGFALTLREVLVKVSGDPRLKDDSRTEELAAHADQFVACFTYADMMANTPLHDEQGTYDRPHKLTVFFDPAKIDTLLARFGDKPWRGERPVIVPVLLVHGPKPPPYVLSADEPRGEEQRGSFTTWADAAGLAVRFPTSAELGEWQVSADHFPDTAPHAAVTATAKDAIVFGTLDWNESLPGWIGKWRLRWGAADHRWSISGVNYDAAFRDIIRGVVLVASDNGSPD